MTDVTQDICGMGDNRGVEGLVIQMPMRTKRQCRSANRLNAIWARSLFVCVLGVITLINSSCYAQDPPTEAQILGLIRQKRVFRCPTSLVNTGCGHRTSPPQHGDMSEKMPRILFASGSSAVSESTRQTLVMFALEMTKIIFSDNLFLVVGHADASGNRAYNQRLSERRAIAVKRLLTRQFGLPPEKLITIGYGENQLANTVDPVARENRRVKIIEVELETRSNRQEKRTAR